MVLMMKITKESQMEEKIINEENKMKRVTIILLLHNCNNDKC